MGNKSSKENSDRKKGSVILFYNVNKVPLLKKWLQEVLNQGLEPFYEVA